MIIKTKRQFYNLYKKQFFGNKPLEWSSHEELQNSKFSGDVSIRGLGVARKLTKYNVKKEDIEKEILNFQKLGLSKEELRFNESMPDNKLLIQGEIYNGIHGLHLTYSDLKKPMNVALKEKEIKEKGLIAKNILKQNLWESSISDLEILFNRHNESVIEFSSFSCPVGNIKGRNTVIWEVRNY